MSLFHFFSLRKQNSGTIKILLSTRANKECFLVRAPAATSYKGCRSSVVCVSIIVTGGSECEPVEPVIPPPRFKLLVGIN